MGVEDIRAAVTAVLPEVQEFFSQYEGIKLGWWRKPITIDFAKIEIEIDAEIKKLPIYEKNLNLFMDYGVGRVPFASCKLARNLLKRACTQGVESAIVWLSKFLEGSSVDARCVRFIYGLKVDELISLNEKLSIVPFEDLPNSKHKKAEVFDPDIFDEIPRPIVCQPSAALVCDVRLGNFWVPSSNDGVLQNKIKEMEFLVHLLSIAAAGPVFSGRAWVEYVDSDFEDVEQGSMWAMSSDEIKFDFIVNRRVEWDLVKEIILKHENLSADFRGVFDLSVQRASLALKRRYIIDKIIDAGIALEVLLGDRDDRGEIGDRLSRRAALLLGGDIAERCDIRKKVKKFYSLRSHITHTGGLGSSNSANEASGTAGLDIVVRCILEALRLGEAPPWEQWELMGRY